MIWKPDQLYQGTICKEYTITESIGKFGIEMAKIFHPDQMRYYAQVYN